MPRLNPPGAGFTLVMNPIVSDLGASRCQEEQRYGGDIGKFGGPEGRVGRRELRVSAVRWVTKLMGRVEEMDASVHALARLRHVISDVSSNPSRVIVTDLVHFPIVGCLLLSRSSSNWPTSLRLEIWEVGPGTLDVRSRIPTVKAKRQWHGPSSHLVLAVPSWRSSSAHFDGFGGFAVAQHDIHDEGRHLRHFLAPVGKDLLCMVLPELFTCQLSRRPRRTVPLWNVWVL
ncbi:hypothetical protein F5148DRAFT_523431 [Russula earlei]|uniref:Uncharacterized protein n=1 Tax=Russula earlei TaxID=71964 RepID=A0ACC0UI43_9AGAM|nr:hypothetical protein F5148DRAFT_523431 [Russula earlei]